MMERTFNYRRVKHMTPEKFVISRDIIYLVDGDEGIWTFEPIDDDTLEIHVHMSEKCRGKECVKKCKAAFNWIFTNTDVTKIVGKIPKHNKRSCFNAVHSGMAFVSETDYRRLYEMRK